MNNNKVVAKSFIKESLKNIELVQEYITLAIEKLEEPSSTYSFTEEQMKTFVMELHKQFRNAMYDAIRDNDFDIEYDFNWRTYDKSAEVEIQTNEDQLKSDIIDIIPDIDEDDVINCVNSIIKSF